MIARMSGRVGYPLRFEGAAYDFGHSIVAIQFSLDDGVTWTTYDTPETNDFQNVGWMFDCAPEEPGCYVLKEIGRAHV